MEKILPNNLLGDSQDIIDIPRSKDFRSTRLGLLLLKFENWLVQSPYNYSFSTEEEYPAIKECLKHFYKGIEINDEDKEIDLNYLSMIIYSMKSTRQFFNILFNKTNSSFKNLFNLSGNINDVISYSDSDNLDMIINVDLLESKDSTEGKDLFERMINNLLYFHNLLLIIKHFILQLQVSYIRNLNVANNYQNTLFYNEYED